LRRALVLGTIAIATLAGCESAKVAAGDAAYQLNPVGEAELTVRSVDVHGPYLVAELFGRREEMQFVAPANAECAALLRPEARLVYAKFGVFGRVASGEQSCTFIGVASLAAWRDRQPRRRGGLVPSGTALYSEVFRDDRMLLLRGRFPTVNRIGIPAAYDLVALVPNDPTCREAAARGRSSIEFRIAGPDAFRLMVGDTPCVPTGFAIPTEAP
jgi:hypothetical protein